MSQSSDAVYNVQEAIAMPADDNVQQAIAMSAGYKLMQPLENMGPARQNMQVVEPVTDAPQFIHHAGLPLVLTNQIIDDQDVAAAAHLDPTNPVIQLMDIDDNFSMEEDELDFPAGSDPGWIDAKLRVPDAAENFLVNFHHHV